MPIITSAKGTILQLSDTASPPSYVGSISQVRSISGPTTKPHTVDITTHDTPLNFRRFLAVLINPGELTFEMNWAIADPTQGFNQGGSLWDQMITLTENSFKMTFPNSFGSMLSKFYLSDHSFNVPVDNVLAVKIGMQLTDQITTSVP